VTYCTQTVAGRIQRRDPSCQTICLRRVFAHEVRNVMGFDRHRRAQADGTAKYPLPKEGQPRPLDAEDSLKKLLPEDTRYWEEGWYIWHTKGKWAGIEKIDLMHRNLGEQEWWYQHLEKRRKEWDNWQKGKDPRANEQAQAEMEVGEQAPQRQNPPNRPIPNQSYAIHFYGVIIHLIARHFPAHYQRLFPYHPIPHHYTSSSRTTLRQPIHS
jgi:hypothetical protein